MTDRYFREIPDNNFFTVLWVSIILAATIFFCTLVNKAYNLNGTPCGQISYCLSRTDRTLATDVCGPLVEACAFPDAYLSYGE